MKRTSIIANLMAAATLTGALVAPGAAFAQDRRDDRYHGDRYSHRQQTKNQWRNIAIGSGALGVLGLLSHDPTLGFAGVAGAAYSAYRYDQDRKSQNRLDRARADYFSRPYFYRDGKRYTRHEYTQDGQKYYQFRRD